MSKSNKQKPTTLLEAAKLFTEESYDHSTMRKVIINLVQHKEATRVLLKEMELISKDLS
jgi:hypothetical protein